MAETLYCGNDDKEWKIPNILLYPCKKWRMQVLTLSYCLCVPHITGEHIYLCKRWWNFYQKRKSVRPNVCLISSYLIHQDTYHVPTCCGQPVVRVKKKFEFDHKGLLLMLFKKYSPLCSYFINIVRVKRILLPIGL